MELRPEKVEKYLKSVIGEGTTVRTMAALGENADDRAQKRRGYGTPIRWSMNRMRASLPLRSSEKKSSRLCRTGAT
jgi:hypothetical protein